MESESDLAQEFLALVEERGASLNAPITDEQVKELGAFLKVPVPPDLLRLLEIGNGQKNRVDNEVFGTELFFRGHENIIEAVQFLRDTMFLEENQNGSFDEAMFVKQGKEWHEEWVPFIYEAPLSFAFIDGDPGIGGVKGQIIVYAPVYGRCGVVAPSLTEFAKLIRGEPDWTISDWPY